MNIKKMHMVGFSPTHTTKTVLESIASGMDIADATLIDMTLPTHAEAIRFGSEEVVIIGAPVYAGRLPVHAVERFRKLKGEHTLAIIVVVYGNREFEDALLELKHLVIEQGFVPVAGAAFIGEHSFSTVEFPVAQGRPDSADMACARAFGEEVHAKIAALESLVGVEIEVPGNFPYKNGMPANSVAPVSGVACTACGVCESVCPTGAIEVGHEVITEASLCIRCCACIRACPHEVRVIEDEAWKAIGVRLHTNCNVPKAPQLFC
ncbi:MAG: 4Fe-4S ferredoxin [Epsilonproteobacteria bacterium]|nr:4Fe-4S ferredoxin [Campylobacterota bacterium]